mgnify:CR=1 FL=1
MLSQPEHVFVVKADLAPSNSKHCGGLLTPYHKRSSLLNSIGEHTSLFWSKKMYNSYFSSSGNHMDTFPSTRNVPQSEDPNRINLNIGWELLSTVNHNYPAPILP